VNRRKKKRGEGGKRERPKSSFPYRMASSNSRGKRKKKGEKKHLTWGRGKEKRGMICSTTTYSPRKCAAQFARKIKEREKEKKHLGERREKEKNDTEE